MYEESKEPSQVGFFQAFLAKTFGSSLRKADVSPMQQIIQTASSPVEEEHVHKQK